MRFDTEWTLYNSTKFAKNKSVKLHWDFGVATMHFIWMQLDILGL